MYSKVFVPHRGYWSSPFSRWQMSFRNTNAIELGAATAKKFLGLRDYDVNMFDSCVLGMTVGQYK
jgi:acetyl-CoA acetyltransferase